MGQVWIDQQATAIIDHGMSELRTWNQGFSHVGPCYIKVQTVVVFIDQRARWQYSAEVSVMIRSDLFSAAGIWRGTIDAWSLVDGWVDDPFFFAVIDDRSANRILEAKPDQESAWR